MEPTMIETPASKLRRLLAEGKLLRMPCVYDALSARLVEEAGFKLTFMSGFSVSAAKLCVPDAGLISYGEMVEQGRNICAATSLPVIGDGDTGFGNAISGQRTIRGYAQAGFAGIMIEDQVAPKRCGHTEKKSVVDRETAVKRMRAVIEARDEMRKQGLGDLVIVARTDARYTLGLDEAIARGNIFHEMGAEVVFIEAPQSLAEMQRICTEVKGYKMANLLENGKTPIPPPSELETMGFALACYPLTLISSAAKAMQDALKALQTEAHPAGTLHFTELQRIVGFPQYDEDLIRLEGDKEPEKNA
eukprot:TRINITY_DN16171_c0_g1_i1.p1 TRINITY_DN16171_c0_g1~~TRINITY_DN16171_c0_g1_i1.p1  ORF type:complete len:321 (+),score=73.60 TRINITY_DN16171_c0_g1_i1:54-965(+)